jgi:tetratricopeptide (TPR) repeat protein
VLQRTWNFKYYLAGSVALIAGAVYLTSLQNAFVNWDDGDYVVNNPYIRTLNAAFLRWAFFDFHASNWHPLTWISHAVDYALWGPNPQGHHLTNIILHAVNSLMVVFLVIMLLKAYRERAMQSKQSSFLHDRSMLVASGMTGVLFGLHPLHVESVAWVAERKDLLCALFFLLSITMYIRYVNLSGADTDQNTRTRFLNGEYLLTFGLFVLALLSKPMAVTLPLVLLILDWCPLKRIRSVGTLRPLLFEKLPFIVLSILSSVLTILAQRAGEAITPTNYVPFSPRLLVAARSLVVYLGKMMVPVNLSPFYPYPREVSFFSVEYLVPTILVVGITTCCVVTARKQQLWLSVWGCYVLTLIPVLGIIQVGSQSMADRYTYLPSIGPFFLMGLGGAWVSNRLNTVRKGKTIASLISITTAILVFVSLGYVTVKQIGIWKNSIVLWNSVVDKEATGPPLAYNNRGMAFYELGKFDKAIEDFDRAISLNPWYIDAYNNRGMVFYELGKFDKAIEDLDRAISLNPSYVDAYNNRGMVFDDSGMTTRALEDYNMAIRLNPSHYKAYNNRGTLYGKAGVLDKAIESFNATIALNPNFADAYYNRGTSYFSAGRFDAAMQDFNRAIFLNQNFERAYLSRGYLYLKTGNRASALSDFRKACDLGNESGCNALRMN